MRYRRAQPLGSAGVLSNAQNVIRNFSRTVRRLSTFSWLKLVSSRPKSGFGVMSVVLQLVEGTDGRLNAIRKGNPTGDLQVAAD